ncbi:MAG: hypothetical protein M1831_004800 [Alyxoria varia]|nr:MAG: hypothetical protein M1831_004800 [Alyxoria varia]
MDTASSTSGTAVLPQSTPRAPRGGFGRGRGSPRNARGSNNNQGARSKGAPKGPQGRKSSASGSSSQEPTKPNTANETTPKPSQTNPDGSEDTSNGDVEAEVCFICASPVTHNSIAPCNHRTCHICSLRLRALYKSKACAHCRANAEYVVFVDDPEKRYEEFEDQEFVKKDDNLGIKYERNEIFEDTILLLRYNCPDPTCDVACYGWPDLHKHVKKIHQKVMCDLCTRNKKVFTHEHELFTPTSLRKHERYGDDNPGAVDQSGFKGHPECAFCQERFYGDDELYTHCRDKHERCHICDRSNSSQRQQYYLDYNQLEVHFSKDHYLCPDQECLEKKFVVFESQMDLKAHQLEAHPNGLSKDARRDARRVDMSGFDYRAPHQQNNRGARREGRGRGRGRDPNVDEAIPVFSAQPRRRDEVAYQRQLEVHSAQSVSTRTFGGQLTTGDAYTARPPENTREPQTVSAPRNANPTRNNAEPLRIENLEIGSSSSTQPQTLSPEDRARNLRHNALTERASNLLGDSPTKMATFRSRVSAFKSSTITASQLIDSFFALFESSSSELGTLIRELADLFEIPSKRDDLLKAWNDWRAINEDYPSLPGMPSASGGGTDGGKKVLRLKNATAQSSRSALRRTQGWESASKSIPSSSVARGGSAFPPMPGTSANASGRSRGGAPPVAWVAPSAAPKTPSANESLRPSPANSRPPSRAANGRYNSNAAKPDSFPALPAAQKLSMSVGKNPVRRDGGVGGSNNAWVNGFGAASSQTGADVHGVAVPDAEDEGQSAKKKGKKKQTLIHWG